MEQKIYCVSETAARTLYSAMLHGTTLAAFQLALGNDLHRGWYVQIDWR